MGRIGTGMNTPTNTATINQNSTRRLRGSGLSSTGGWFMPPVIRRISPTMTNQISQGSAAHRSR